MQESLILFASLNLRRSRKLCQGGVDNGDNDETRLLNHVGTLSDDWTEEVGNCPAFHFLVQQQTNASWWSLHCSTFAAHRIIILGCLWPLTIPRAHRVYICSTSLDARGLLACFHCCGRGGGVLSWGELQQLEQTLPSGRQLLQLPRLSSRNLSTWKET